MGVDLCSVEEEGAWLIVLDLVVIDLLNLGHGLARLIFEQVVADLVLNRLLGLILKGHELLSIDAHSNTQWALWFEVVFGVLAHQAERKRVDVGERVVILEGVLVESRLERLLHWVGFETRAMGRL